MFTSRSADSPGPWSLAAPIQCGCMNTTMTMIVKHRLNTPQSTPTAREWRAKRLWGDNRSSGLPEAASWLFSMVSKRKMMSAMLGLRQESEGTYNLKECFLRYNLWRIMCVFKSWVSEKNEAFLCWPLVSSWRQANDSGKETTSSWAMGREQLDGG